MRFCETLEASRCRVAVGPERTALSGLSGRRHHLGLSSFWHWKKRQTRKEGSARNSWSVYISGVTLGNGAARDWPRLQDHQTQIMDLSPRAILPHGNEDPGSPFEGSIKCWNDTAKGQLQGSYALHDKSRVYTS